MKTRVVLADDHTITREGLRALLAQHLDIEIVGEADNGRTAVQLALELVPDVVIMDLSMPELNGVEATRRIVKACPQVRVIALSMHSASNYVNQTLQSGASGYLTKESAFQDIVKAIRAVQGGRSYISPDIIDAVVEGVSSPRSRSGGKLASLTAREREVLQLLAESRTTKEIAAHLNISVYTVDSHRRRIIDKLGIRDVAGLTRFAIREGLTSLD
ncbi:MAG: response regulator transcription factor [Proteobacteria bacterium]|nr:response regulator transcription factor [Pseudomonadota bacterium]